VFWDLFQQYQIGRLDEKIAMARADAAEQGGMRMATQAVDERVDRLVLMCHALFELVGQSTGITEEQLKAKIVEVDLRDGTADGKIAPKPKRCPKCEAMISPKFGRCLFCGHQDASAPVVR
jgi:hypothetical protein